VFRSWALASVEADGWVTLSVAETDRLHDFHMSPEIGLDLELRRHIADHMAVRRDVIVADTVATFPLSSDSRRLDASYCVRLGNLATRLLGEAIVDGRIDSRGPSISELAALLDDREVSPDQLFTFVHITMSTSIDELSLDQRVGANTEPWPQACQIIRRAAFDVLGAWATRLMYMPQPGAIQDPLTTLHTRPVLDAVLPKECCRAERFEHWVSILLIDIDNLSAINKAHGYGVGDRILERMGILLRAYFREHDWVVRYAEDAIAVLLPETNPEDAMTLAERTRTMVEERLTFRDYRTEQRIVVTVSVAVTSARALEGEPIDHERFSAEAEAALERAKVGGRNRVEHVELLPRLISIDEATRLLNTDIQGIEKLVAEGRLDPVNAGRHVRLEREAVQALAAAPEM
jgi:diguanylate cyclase (GGDEF)-like protein/excisionase family DNA binding protein